MDCVFCKIAQKKISSNIIYEDEKILVFKDLNPEAPVHLLVIPKKHINSVADITKENSEIIAHIFEKISQIHIELGLEKGMRIINNYGKNGGQTVEHIHFHILGGRELTWPPG